MQTRLSSVLVVVAVLVFGIALGLGLPRLLPKQAISPIAQPDVVNVDAARAAGADMSTDNMAARLPFPTTGRRAPDPEQVMRALDEAFLSEPRTASWAQFNEQQVKAALSDEALVKQGIPPVISSAIECHSSTCRIDLQMIDDPTTTATQTVLLQAIAGSLDHTRAVYLPTSDGELAMRIYATHSPASNQKPPSGVGALPGQY